MILMLISTSTSYTVKPRDETRGLCQKRCIIGLKGTSCILYVHKHRSISPRDDEYGRAQVRMHTNEGVHEVHDTMGFR